MEKYFILLIAISFGCKDSPTNTSSLKGDMAGYVLAADSNSIASNGIVGADTLNNAGVTISIDGTPFSAVTDSSGRWGMQNVPAGTYDISFRKNGYALWKRIAYHFIGNGFDYLGH